MFVIIFYSNISVMYYSKCHVRMVRKLKDKIMSNGEINE